MMPLGVHGDGGAFNKQDSLYGFAWSSLLSSGQTIEARFLFTVIKKSELVADTVDKLMEMFGWS